MALPSSARPLYERLKDYILERIGSGAWTPDQRIPSEHELVAQFGVSRMTVHRALRELTAAGVLLRVQGVGTFVAPARPQWQWPLMEVRDIAQEIAARGHRHTADVHRLEAMTADKTLAREFGFARPRQVFHSLIVHREDDEAVQLEDRYVNPLLAPDYLAQDFTRTTPHEYIQRCAPVTEVEHMISACQPDARSQRLLGLKPDTPCLLLRRRTWAGPTVATVTRLLYPGPRYSLGSRYKFLERRFV